jgi:hypothetical protein
MKLVGRGLFGPPPPGPQTEQDNHATLLWSWFCTMIALITIMFRIFGRLTRNSQLFREDRVMLLSIVPLMTRMGLIHVVLLWGTNNVDLSVGLSQQDIDHRVIGSKLVLGARIFYALLYVLEFSRYDATVPTNGYQHLDSKNYRIRVP